MAKQDKEKGHFTGQGDCNIHTSRSGTKCKNAKPGCNYKTNCEENCPEAKWLKNGQWVWGYEWEAHHILCIEAVNWYLSAPEGTFNSKEKQNISNVYREALWCINQTPNMIALPRKRVYVKYNGSRAVNLPCHCWDHNIVDGYNDEVRGAIHTQVWQKIKKAAATDLCKLAESAVTKQLASLSKRFDGELRTRGARPVGKSRAGIEAAWHESKKPVNERAPKWWYSFSMAKDSVALVREPLVIGGAKGFEMQWSASERLEKRRAKAGKN